VGGKNKVGIMGKKRGFKGSQGKNRRGCIGGGKFLSMSKVNRERKGKTVSPKEDLRGDGLPVSHTERKEITPLEEGKYKKKTEERGARRRIHEKLNKWVHRDGRDGRGKVEKKNLDDQHTSRASDLGKELGKTLSCSEPNIRGGLAGLGTENFCHSRVLKVLGPETVTQGACQGARLHQKRGRAFKRDRESQNSIWKKVLRELI